jgi:hypothetical protein
MPITSFLPIWPTHIVICRLSNSAMFFQNVSWKAPFLVKLIEQKMCVFNFSVIFYKTFLILSEFTKILSQMYKGLHVNCCYSCKILMKLEFSPQISEIYKNIKFKENPSSGSWVVICRQRDMTQKRVTFQYFVMQPKIICTSIRSFYIQPDDGTVGAKHLAYRYITMNCIFWWITNKHIFCSFHHFNVLIISGKKQK